MKSRTYTTACAVALAVITVGPMSGSSAALSPSKGVEIFSNLGPKGDRCNGNGAGQHAAFWSEFGYQVESGPEAVAFGFFTYHKSWTVTSLRLPLAYFKSSGPGHTFQVMLVNNVGGGYNAPQNVHSSGAVLAQQTTSRAFPGGPGCKLQTVTFPTGASIGPNNLYWIVILASSDTRGGWADTYRSFPKLNRHHVVESESTDQGSSWTYEANYDYPGAFAVYGTPAGN